MKLTFCITFLLFTMSAAAQNTGEFDIKAAQRFANLALACVHKEYPNHISHTLNSDADAAPPRKLTPAFYGCYDWHSSVHGHWLLVRLVRSFPDAPFVPAARETLLRSLTAENIVQEAAYEERDEPVLSARMGWHGSFNWLRNCASGTMLLHGVGHDFGHCLDVAFLRRADILVAQNCLDNLVRDTEFIQVRG